MCISECLSSVPLGNSEQGEIEDRQLRVYQNPKSMLFVLTCRVDPIAALPAFIPSPLLILISFSSSSRNTPASAPSN